MHCGDCRFWHQPAAQCRRNAPLPMRGAGQQGNTDTAWPAVAADEWCGEYQPGYIDRTSLPAGAQSHARSRAGRQESAQH
ncbi:hypothetical protein [Methylosinus sporium]|uniref:hypothetical protein n=2 Tax=Methylosinus TaxID=425 RepID=UPI00115E6BA1|nr:hypothetical protein [Methylosinus sporium]